VIGRALSAVVAACALLTFAASTRGAPRPAPAVRPPPRRLPAPPTLPRIRVEVSKGHVLVIHDVRLGRGDWTSGDFDGFVAFGAPGVPRAVDARLYADTDDDEGPADGAPYDVVPMDRAFRRPSNARLLLGSGAMAGAVLHLREAAFRRATAAGAARIRIRSLLDLPAPDRETGREVVVRLGAHEGEPYALGAIEVASTEPRPWVTRAAARLCGPEADDWPLAVRIRAALAAAWQPSPAAGTRTPVAPVSSVRHASDDLCVRFWTAPEP